MLCSVGICYMAQTFSAGHESDHERQLRTSHKHCRDHSRDRTWRNTSSMLQLLHLRLRILFYIYTLLGTLEENRYTQYGFSVHLRHLQRYIYNISQADSKNCGKVRQGSPILVTERWTQSWSRCTGSQPAGDYKSSPSGRLPLLSARPVLHSWAFTRWHHP